MNQYGAYVENIKKEESIRVNHILANRRRSAELEEQQKYAEAFHASEMAAAERRVAEQEELRAAVERQQRLEDRKARSQGKGRRAAGDAPKASKSRLLELSRPKERGEAMYGSGTYGKCMHQKTNRVEFPQGRNGAVYTPGVDRDRIVPFTSSQRRLGDSSRNGGKTNAQGVARRLSQEEREAIIDRIQESHKKNVAFADAQAGPNRSTLNQEHDQDDDKDSVFSHTSSNGPIKATGVPHMTMHSERDTTVRHLHNYGGSMTAPRAESKNTVDFDSMPLQEVTARIVRMQNSTKRY
ncbi:hypothetical protein AGDE_12146 [Angomonas deanei]|uniref:Uncharacterized protein n=1 Tax=Angomonas deanei TaxID=59799 RepID=A0A7G2CNE1_9TRYP|nr:hypothetical protein AGDE_12146 [Angomonas deanei]CAD2219742.1 hypothetical protein, conserved [Angomonas deanei]|eukprot:EPY24839.1 hypothetical protein AGDE_12146 [Angomonas deanei]